MEVLLRNKRSKMEGKERGKRCREKKKRKKKRKKKVYRDRQKIPFVINKSIYCIRVREGISTQDEGRKEGRMNNPKNF